MMTLSSAPGHRGGTIAPGTDVIVLGLHLNGAAMLRHLPDLGYTVCGITDKPDEAGLRSRHGTRLQCPDPLAQFDLWVEFMEALGERCSGRPALLPTADRFVLALDKAAHRLERAFRFHGFGTGIRTALTAKLTTLDLAARHGVPTPATRVVRSGAELMAFCSSTAWPALIKPNLSVSWHGADVVRAFGYRKALTAATPAALVAEFERIQRVTPDAVAQEVIVGPDRNHVTFVGFAGSDGHVRGRIVARKLRLLPIHFGSGSFVQLEDMPELETLGERFLRAVGYRGTCCMSFKIDARDGVAKLFEVNPRSGLWDAIGTPAGVDFAHEEVASLFGEEREPHRATSFAQKWVYLLKDLRSARHYHAEGSMGYAEWLRSLSPPLMVSDLPWRDDTPFAWANFISLAGELAKGIARG